MITKIGITLLLLACVFRLGLAWGQSDAEIANRAYLDYKSADESLNVAYKQLIAATRGEQRTKLAAAQHAWIKYRDANAAAEAFPSKGGAVYPLVSNNIATRMTKARTAELLAFLSELKSH